MNDPNDFGGYVNYKLGTDDLTPTSTKKEYGSAPRKRSAKFVIKKIIQFMLVLIFGTVAMTLIAICVFKVSAAVAECLVFIGWVIILIIFIKIHRYQ